MQPSQMKFSLKKAFFALTILLAAAGISAAQTVPLTATRQTVVMPDGTSVPMWGWVCGQIAAPGAGAVAPTCTALNGSAQTGGTTWQPPLITVPAGSGLSINLTNALPVETSLVIVGQLPGGGVGSPVREAGPRTDGAHAGQTQTTWNNVVGATFTPPAQGQRARSFAPEIAANAGTPQSYTYSWTNLRAGTYLIESGTYPSIQGPMGLYGVLVVTTAPVPATNTTAFVPGTAYTGSTSLGNYAISYDADVPLLLGEIDPVQNNAVELFEETAASCPVNVGTCTGTISPSAETAKWTQACSQSHTCYPAAVNYTPMYYTVNGVSFDSTVGGSSAATIPGTISTGNVILRFVNAGLRIHSPAVSGLNMSLIAEDANVLPDVALAASKNSPLTVRVQSNVFLPAGKVYDVIVSPANNGNPSTQTAATNYNANAYQIFDRELSLSSNGTRRDSGMQTSLLVNGASAAYSPAQAQVNPDSYFVSPGVTLSITDPGKGVVANDLFVNGVQVLTPPTLGTLTLNADGTFTYIPGASFTTTSTDTFQYYANNNTKLFTTVTLGHSTTLGQAPTAAAVGYASNIATLLKMNRPGVLANDSDPNNYPLTAAFPPSSALYKSAPMVNANGSSTVTLTDGSVVTLMPDGSFTAIRACTSPCTTGGMLVFPHIAVNSENVSSLSNTTAANQMGNVTLQFNKPTGLQVTVQDAGTKAPITDYKWIIEQDLTFKVDPSKQIYNGKTVPPTLGTQFHTSYMPVIASGCTGAQSCERGQSVYDPATQSHVPAVCEGSGVCVQAPAGSFLPATTPDQVALNATNPDGTPASYYISILPGDAANSFNTGNTSAPTPDPALCGAGKTPTGQSVDSICGHTMGGAPILAPSTVGGTPAPVVVNVEPNPLKPATVTAYVFEDDWPLNGEPDAGGGVDTLATQEVPLEDFQLVIWDDAGSSGDATGQMTYDMFNNPLTNALNGTIDPATGLDACPISNNGGQNAGSTALVGVIIVCPRYESDGKTLSPLTGQAVIRNLMPGRFGITVHPGAAREARGEEWLQTNTLDGTHFLDSFVRVGEPAYFQEFGPGGYHVFFGEANPAIINARLKKDVCVTGVVCNNVISGQVSNLHMARPPNEYLSDSSVNPLGDPVNYQSLAHTQCFISLGDPDGETFAFTKCDQNGNFTFPPVPDGDYALVAFDQWLDLIVDGTSKSVSVRNGQGAKVDFPAFSWQTHIWSNTYLDLNGNGIQDQGEPGLIQVPTRVRMRNGKINNTLFSDINGLSHFNETFPLFNWYVVESDTTRFKGTGVHVVYDAGGQLDGPAPTGNGLSNSKYAGLLNSKENFPIPNNLRIPGAVYCSTADCANQTIQSPGGPGGSTGRIDPGSVVTEGLQGFLSQTEILDWGKRNYVVGETGGIRGHVVYASTRPFDDPSQLFQNLWEPLVPGVTINLYKEGTAPDGTTSLKLIDTTTTSSWDAFAQGVRADGVTPNMSCPGQDPNDPFLPYTLTGTTNYLYPNVQRPDKSQFKCYDSLRVFNQVQPAPYDGLYQFPTTHCTGCTANPSDGTQMLLPGKYVVEEVTPAGYEVVKEEDKNILIGDNYIAPVTQQFAGITNIFIVPDQATINNTNPAYGTGGGATDPTTDLGHTLPSTFGPGGLMVMTAPCVGISRIVPDYMSISPESGQVAPFAGATRNLCDRKEITLQDQMQGQADFFIWTKTPAASHFTGFILDDFSSEFDPASPAFGEKFAIPNLPISFRDFNGNEVARFYSDQWGIFNGLNYSTWEVNPPNPTGYAPNMMVTCMNDPGPIPGPNGTMITDPYYNPAYSNFCYENAFMPADTAYLDTPVVPTSAFAEGYNPPDCAYPDATPAIAEVDGDLGTGPWVSQVGNTLTIKALGDQIVPNHAYSGPSAAAAPYNQKTITRHYGFGAQTGMVTIGGKEAKITNWADNQIQVVAPAGVPLCQIQQVNSASEQHCGELVITAANGKQSIDTVTVTIGGNTPKIVPQGSTIQSMIDAATPGDMIIVPAGTYTEMLLMWKPVRLQGVGAASVTVNANTHPSGVLLEPWRRQVNCLFGLALNGGTLSAQNPYDPSNTFTCTSAMQNQVDPIPLEAVIGWDATTNGNLAELLQEPTLMGAYEGAAITVLAKGMENPAAVAGGASPIPLNNTTDCQFVSNFLCAPARIDGLTFTNSSQGGGGIFLHGWTHFIEVSNNRIHGNSGTLAGGIVVGQPEANEGTAGPDGRIPPYLYDTNVNIHNNAITFNSAYGDELNSNTPAAAGGVTMCLGSDYYKFNYNWVCGNMSTGDGGGFSHYGLSYAGDIEHNSFVFNQSYNTTLTTHGGGVVIQGGPPDGTACENAQVDMDCPPGLTDGAGYNIVFNANLVLGNTAESGSGGGLRLQNINGNDIVNNPTRANNWYNVSVTNNIIANNVAGWIGGGVSLYDAINVNFVNNTVVSNDNTASAGVLFDTLGAPNANQPPPGCNPTVSGSCPFVTTSNFEPAGFATEANSALLKGAFTAQATSHCPVAQCNKFSVPVVLDNNLFWQNRSFHISTAANPIVGEQTVVTLVPQLSQSITGACPSTGFNGGPGPTYWDIGVYNDMQAGDHSSGLTLKPMYSILDDPGYTGNGSGNLSPAAAGLVSQYCNGSRVPPEISPLVCSSTANAPGCTGGGGNGSITVPPGVPDINPFYPLFTLSPAATTDEGNNFINMFYGPLSLSNSTIAKGSNGYNVPLGNYSITSNSPARDAVPRRLGLVQPNPAFNAAPSTDFFGNPRPDASNPNALDIGAVEFAATGNAVANVTPTSLSFGTVGVTGISSAKTLTLHNTGTGTLTDIAVNFTGPFTAADNAGTCGSTLFGGQSCTINVVFEPTATGPANGTVVITASANVAGSPVKLTGTGAPLVVKATLVPGNWAPIGTRSCPGSNFFQFIQCLLEPAQMFTLTNAGNVPLNNLSYALTGANTADYALRRQFSNCGTTLANGANCFVVVQFQPQTSEAAGTKNASLTVNFTAGDQVATPGAQAATLTGKAN